MTLVVIRKEEFESLNDERLGWTLMEPTFLQIRGKNFAVKNQVISKLTSGQKALCMFRVMYDHSKNSPEEYYAWISYMLDQPGYWPGVMEGLHFFADSSMMSLLEESKEVFASRNRRLGVQWSDAAFRDMDQDHELRNEVQCLYERFQQISPDSLRRISEYVRSNPQEFVEIKD